MKKLVSCIIALTIFAGGLFCAQQTDNKPDNNLSQDNYNRFFLGVDWNHIRQKMDSGKISGNPYALVVGYEYIRPDFLYFYATTHWEVARGKGTVNNSAYKGYDHLFSIKSNIGWNFSINMNDKLLELIPFIGIFFSHSRGKGYTPSYCRGEVRSYYLPAGIFLNWKISPEFDIGIKGIALFSLSDKTVMKEGSKANESSKAKTTVDWEVEVPIKYNITPAWALAITPYYGISKSTPKTNTSVFGTSTTTISYLGGKIDIGYCF